MEPVRGPSEASECSQEDFISSMPNIVITNIMDRLPIKEAVATSVLSSNWRFNWTMITQLVCDSDFFYSLSDKYKNYERIVSWLLNNLKGPIKKFSFDRYKNVSFEDHWVMILSSKRIKELSIISYLEMPLKLPRNLFSCLELKHLELNSCFFHRTPSFHGFLNLRSLDMMLVRFKSGGCGEIISWCPLLEILKINSITTTSKIKQSQIAKLENLKKVSLPLCVIDDGIPITTSSIFEIVGFLPKLQYLCLDFIYCKIAVEAGGRKIFSTAFPCLETLVLKHIDHGSYAMLSCAFDMIWGSPKLQKLHISATCPWPSPIIDVDRGRMGQLQLRSLSMTYHTGPENDENDICLIKALLACSPLLEKITICSGPFVIFEDQKLLFANKMLKLHRASPTAEVNISYL